mmetsp:Transcript_12600/g.37886  ORF Transcript_12600/g.37886 Transcript_12600/m.37886 type:complete len:245 (+) Transcript_12600:2302-3036(+)
MFVSKTTASTSDQSGRRWCGSGCCCCRSWTRTWRRSSPPARPAGPWSWRCTCSSPLRRTPTRPSPEWIWPPRLRCSRNWHSTHPVALHCWRFWRQPALWQGRPKSLSHSQRSDQRLRALCPRLPPIPTSLQGFGSRWRSCSIGGQPSPTSSPAKKFMRRLSAFCSSLASSRETRARIAFCECCWSWQWRTASPPSSPCRRYPRRQLDSPQPLTIGCHHCRSWPLMRRCGFLCCSFRATTEELHC